MSTTPNMSCPSGGTFYACGDGSRFVGCCGRNPCGSTGCADGDLQPASFEGTQHGLIPDQQCEAGAFYTCNGTNPPFWGCCASSPCSDGCPEGLLSAAFLTSNPATSEPFLRLNLTWTDEQTSGSADTSTNAGAIAGGVVGGVVALTILIIGLIWFHRRRKRAARREQQAQAGSQPRLSELPPQDRTDGSAMKYLPQSYQSSPAMPSWPSSPGQPPYSPQPPSYWSEVQHQRHISHELPGSSIQTELEGEAESRQQKKSPVEAEA